MIKNTYYKDRPATEIVSEQLTATFLPSDGAKLVSLKDNHGHEFLAQREGLKYRKLGIDTSYIEAECSAFDDMFPTIDPCTINGMDYLDHGEVARREHKFYINDNSLNFSCTLEKLNIKYQKTAFVEQNTLVVKYKIQNLNNFNFPYIFAGHIMLKGELGAEISSAFDDIFEKQIMFGRPKFSPNVMCEFNSDKEWKYYYKGAITPLVCTVNYPESNYRLTLSSDSEIIKYLGVWINPGDLNGMYNLALEPCSALYDSPQKAGDTCSYIKANSYIEFTLKITIERQEN